MAASFFKSGIQDTVFYKTKISGVRGGDCFFHSQQFPEPSATRRKFFGARQKNKYLAFVASHSFTFCSLCSFTEAKGNPPFLTMLFKKSFAKMVNSEW
ncbi:hypothetical protein [Foetidibacter luteolus]|uniref:hypothetical protein n=1 Tax=Foetidibacter luteolus TaxID=2608880 RepID=UPI00129B0837|nr:hypothetical protein [Foetidibacter luteolus]